MSQLKRSLTKQGVDISGCLEKSDLVDRCMKASVQSKGPVPTGPGTNSTGEDFSALSVTELKRRLKEKGVDCRDCFEKRDLVERLTSHCNVKARQ